MKKFSICFATIFVLVISSIVVSACSDNELVDLENKTTDVLTKHVIMSVQQDSMNPTRFSDKQSRFEAILPPEGNGKIFYRYTKGEKLHAFTKIGDKYHQSDLMCTHADSVTGKANFEGDIQYSETDRTVYLCLGRVREFDGTNLVQLYDYGSPWLPTYAGRLVSSEDISKVGPVVENYSYVAEYGNAFGIYQYGKTVITDDTSLQPIKLNMVTSFATFGIGTWDGFAPETLTDYPTVYIRCIADSATKTGFVQDPYLNLETGEVVSKTNHYSSSYFYNGRIGCTPTMWNFIAKEYDGLVAFPLFPGDYKDFQIIVKRKEKDGHTYLYYLQPWSFSTVIGNPNEVDKPKEHIYSSNRNFNFYFKERVDITDKITGPSSVDSIIAGSVK